MIDRSGRNKTTSSSKQGMKRKQMKTVFWRSSSPGKLMSYIISINVACSAAVGQTSTGIGCVIGGDPTGSIYSTQHCLFNRALEFQLALVSSKGEEAFTQIASAC